jgi:hypothetical protein
MVVVVRFEAVNVAQHERQRTLVPVRNAHLICKVSVEETPVGKTCQSSPGSASL